MTERSCENCEWWCGFGEPTCHRNPPEVPKKVYYPADDVDYCHPGTFPFAAPTDWCGEFKPREDET